MPESPISAMLLASRVRTDGSNAAITGINKSPISAVNTTRTATSVSLKKRSTRYLSKCVEMAHKIGPENAKTSQLMKSCLESYLCTIGPAPLLTGALSPRKHSPAMAAAMPAFYQSSTFRTNTWTRTMQALSATDVINLLALKPHPEGGHFRETFRDDRAVAGGRAASTAIYFLL